MPKVKITNKLWYPPFRALCKNQDNLGILSMHDEILQKIEQFMRLPLKASIISIKKAYASMGIKLTRSHLIKDGKYNLITYYNNNQVFRYAINKLTTYK